MPRSFLAEDSHVDAVRVYLDDYVGLEHVRVRKSDDLLVFESGPNDDVVPHPRFRRIGVDRWQIEMPAKGGGGGWEGIPVSVQLHEALDIVIKEFPWMLAPRR